MDDFDKALAAGGGTIVVRGGLGNLLRRAKAICETDGRAWHEIAEDVRDQYIELARSRPEDV